MWADAEPIFHGIPDVDHVLRVLLRLMVAALFGAIIGFERQHEGKAAGMRTQMLVAVGAALFVVVGLEAGWKSADLSRVVQGIVTGLGFLGGGSILKLSGQQQIKGLTTAASIWVTAACGVAIGLGWLWPAVLGVVLGWITLQLMHFVEHWLLKRFPPICHDPQAPPHQSGPA
jgi:putative Mg2+ transporter-C (MgtC) family protein